MRELVGRFVREIEGPHGLTSPRSLSAGCGTRPGARGWGTRVLFSACHDLGISLETALATARQALTSAAERAKQPGLLLRRAH